MVEAIKKLRYSNIDQECLIKNRAVEGHKDHAYFQPKESAVVENVCKCLNPVDKS